MEFSNDWQPHLIWMALPIADTDGYEITRHIRAIEHHQLQPETPADLWVPTKIIALTVNAEHERPKALASGCYDSVAKPLNPDVILQKIAEHLAIEYEYYEQLMWATTR